MVAEVGRKRGAAEAGLAPARRIEIDDVKRLFAQQKGHLEYFFSQLDFDELASFCEKIMQCKGTTLFTGIGKSAYIAKKVCQTLVSTGTRSTWLAPVDALHGDIGVLSRGDILVMLSKSGETEELVTLLPYAKAKGAFVVAATDARDSTLGRRADMCVRVPSDGELTPFNDAPGAPPRLAPPSTYTALQMLFGDTCAVYLMELKGLTQNQYAMNHPAGRIGKRLVLRVDDVMKPWGELPLVKPDMNGVQALVAMAGTSKGCGCLLVVDDERRLLGTFSDADLRRALTKNGQDALQMAVRALMNYDKEYPRTTTAGAMAFDAHLIMEKGRNGRSVDYLPVLNEDGTKTLAGLVTMRGLAECGL